MHLFFELLVIFITIAKYLSVKKRCLIFLIFRHGYVVLLLFLLFAAKFRIKHTLLDHTSHLSHLLQSFHQIFVCHRCTLIHSLIPGLFLSKTFDLFNVLLKLNYLYFLLLQKDFFVFDSLVSFSQNSCCPIKLDFQFCGLLLIDFALLLHFCEPGFQRFDFDLLPFQILFQVSDFSFFLVKFFTDFLDLTLCTFAVSL